MAKLYFYYSAMNAGKTTTLLQSAHNYRERGMRTLILTPRLDHRAGSGTVASRIGLQAEGVAFDRDDDLEALVARDIAAHGTLDCLLVDEAQFLSKAQVWQLSEVVDALRVPVLCYGLRTDFRGELFEVVLAAESRGLRAQADPRGDDTVASAVVQARGQDQDAHAALAVVVRRLQQGRGLPRIHRRVVEVELGHLKYSTCLYQKEYFHQLVGKLG